MMQINNTFGIKAYAKRVIEYKSEEELVSLIPSLHGEKYFHVGGGSNLLFVNDFDGIILHSCIKGFSVTDDEIRVGAGVVWDDFVEWSVLNGWSGIENLSFIPGEVGASAVQNIGAYGVEVKDVITKVDCVDLQTGERRTFTNKECNYAYRQSIFKKELKGKYAVTYVTYKLSRTFAPKLEYGNIIKSLPKGIEVTPTLVRNTIIDIRKQKLPDPKVYGNAGSFFMNPVVSHDKFLQIQKDYPDMPYYETDNGVKIPAGWMIEQCGWKGKSLGKAAVHDKQALVLVNLGGATGKDILHLCDVVRGCVKEKFDIDIHPEVNII
ncbi:MAG: UDP-N-acetylmuramate dehydrogenase [Bacteroidaceae bacterium]|nr:UDP-N-acetylmuramate dehydrogenase [Bacteroidaceae bacterium]